MSRNIKGEILLDVTTAWEIAITQKTDVHLITHKNEQHLIQIDCFLIRRDKINSI